MGSRAAAAWIAELNAVQALAASVPEADLENATASLRELRARLEAARAAAERRPLLHCLASCLDNIRRGSLKPEKVFCNVPKAWLVSTYH